MNTEQTIVEAREYLADRRCVPPQVHSMVVALDELAIKNADLKVEVERLRAELAAVKLQLGVGGQ